LVGKSLHIAPSVSSFEKEFGFLFCISPGYMFVACTNLISLTHNFYTKNKSAIAPYLEISFFS
jgi:hypothetical protein